MRPRRYVEGAGDDEARFVRPRRVALRVMTWLRKRGYAKDDDCASNDTPARSFVEVLADVATQPAFFHKP